MPLEDATHMAVLRQYGSRSIGWKHVLVGLRAQLVQHGLLASEHTAAQDDESESLQSAVAESLHVDEQHCDGPASSHCSPAADSTALLPHMPRGLDTKHWPFASSVGPIVIMLHGENLLLFAMDPSTAVGNMTYLPLGSLVQLSVRSWKAPQLCPISCVVTS